MGVRPAAWGKARVRKVGREEVDLQGGGKASLERWLVEGDCGTYSVYLDASGEAGVMVAGETRYDRLR